MLRNQGNAKSDIVTTLRTIEPYVLKALIKEDLHRHPMSKISEIASRIPDVEIKEIRKFVYSMVGTEIAKKGARVDCRLFNLMAKKRVCHKSMTHPHQLKLT